jgi:hypothetical protein
VIAAAINSIAPRTSKSRISPVALVRYNERRWSTRSLDAGAQIRDGIKSVAKQACKETIWPHEAMPADPHRPFRRTARR